MIEIKKNTIKTYFKQCNYAINSLDFDQKACCYQGLCYTPQECSPYLDSITLVKAWWEKVVAIAIN